MPLNLKFKKKASTLKVVIAKRVVVLRNIVNVIKAECNVLTYALVKDAKIAKIT